MLTFRYAFASAEAIAGSRNRHDRCAGDSDGFTVGKFHPGVVKLSATFLQYLSWVEFIASQGPTARGS